MIAVITNMDVPLESTIRTCLRTEKIQRRRYQRDYNLNNKRNIVKETIYNLERIITLKEVETIAANIKQKKVTINELALLKLSFLQNSDNITVFLKIKGSLYSLIRELTGNNSNYQLAASECLCNLALGNPKNCLNIAKAGSPYLISHLQGLNYNLMNTSVWTLGNLAGSDIKSWEVVRSQGLLQRLIQLLKVPELVDNTLYAIVQFIKIGLNKLEATELNELSSVMIQELPNTPTPNRCLALYLLSCSELTEDILLENKIVEKCLNIIESCIVTVETVKSITSLVRIIANQISEKTGVVVASVLANWKQFQLVVNNLLFSDYSHFKIELMWLVGNIINHPSSAVQETLQNKTDKFTFLFK